jgi:hypothetical protein
MGSATDLAENKILDHFLGLTEFAFDTTLFVGLATATIADDDDTIAEITECTGTGYARQAVEFNAASGGSSTNNGAVTFGPATAADWGTITDMFICTAVSGECNVLWYDALATSKAVGNGESLTFANGSGITVTLT